MTDSERYRPKVLQILENAMVEFHHVAAMCTAVGRKRKGLKKRERHLLRLPEHLYRPVDLSHLPPRGNGLDIVPLTRGRSVHSAGVSTDPYTLTHNMSFGEGIHLTLIDRGNA